MEASTGGKIEVFAPFSSALDLTKLILFQPFDLTKWFAIGFAAFLSHLGGGGGLSYNRRLADGDWNWRMRSVGQEAFGSWSGMPAWLIPVLIVMFLLILVIVLVLAWVGARGRFIFTDCIVRNRGAIAEPWHEFRKEGNSYFLFMLVIMASVLCVTLLASLPLWLPLLISGAAPQGVGLILGLLLFGLVMIVVGVTVSLLAGFMVPVMYRRRCRAMEALRATMTAVTSQPGPVILYLLFSIVLWVAIAMVACLTTCVTCCITAIPYVGTVILLPLYVFPMSYLLLFVRQFGNDYDAWANVPVAAV